MRGFQQPSVRSTTNDAQQAFAALSRHRRTKLARTAQTTLVKADQWSHGRGAEPEIAKALEAGLKALQAKGAKK
jgi:hypothetical protein